MEFFGFIA
jgi:hypothetical protein